MLPHFAAPLTAFALVISCGARTEPLSSTEETGAAASPPVQATDPCSFYDGDRIGCCDAGCNAVPTTPVCCVSAEFDCGEDNDICGPRTTCQAVCGAEAAFGGCYFGFGHPYGCAGVCEDT